jgi:uncharacterized protein
MDGFDGGKFDGFEWGRGKSRADPSGARNRLRFRGACLDGAYVEREDRRGSYGEHRFIVTGEVDAFTVTVVWTPRPPNRRIIAAWPANQRETRRFNGYRQAHKPAGSRE